MKKIHYLCSTCMITCATLAYADILSPDIFTSNQNKLVLDTPLSQSSDNIKMAKATFMGGSESVDNNSTFTTCPDDQIYAHGSCVLNCNSSTGKNYYWHSQGSLNNTNGKIITCYNDGDKEAYTSCNQGYEAEKENGKIKNCKPKTCNRNAFPYNEEAFKDIEKVLELEPNNERALDFKKDLLDTFQT